MERVLFEKLFDYLDIKLEENECDDTNKLTREFLTKNKIENNQAVLIGCQKMVVIVIAKF
jgi:hypothetical protein